MGNTSDGLRCAHTRRETSPPATQRPARPQRQQGQPRGGGKRAWAGQQGKALTSPRAPPLQPVGLLAAAQAVDEGAELLHVTDVLRRDHLLLDYVCLRQIGPFLK